MPEEDRNGIIVSRRRVETTQNIPNWSSYATFQICVEFIVISMISHRSRVNCHLNTKCTTIFDTHVYIFTNIERKPLHDTKFINFREERNIRAPIHTRNHVRLNIIWRRSSTRRTRSRSYFENINNVPTVDWNIQIREYNSVVELRRKEINAIVTFDGIFNIIRNGVYVCINNK